MGAAGLALIFFSLPLYLIRFSAFGIPSTLLEVIIWIAFALFLIRGGLRKDPFLRLDKATLAGLGGLLIASAISLAVSSDFRSGLGLFKGFILDPILVLLMLRLANLSAWPELPWRTYNISALILAGWGLYQWATPHLDPYYRPTGPFESPNYLAFYLVPAIMYVIYRLLALSIGQKILALAELIILTAGLFVTESRGGLLGLTAGLVVWAAWLVMQRSRLKKGLGIAAAVVGLKVLYYSVTSHPERIVGSNDVRETIWSHATHLLRLHPLTGTGLGGFHQAMAKEIPHPLDLFQRVARDVSNAHNLYLTLWLNLGLLGLFSILWFVAISVRKAWSLRQEPLVWAGIAALASILAHGFVDTPVWKNDLFPIFWLAVATPWLIPAAKAKTAQKASK